MTNSGDGTVSVIDAVTGAVTAHHRSCRREPLGVAGNQSRRARVYVANQFGDTVSVIDTATNTVTATIAVGDTPRGVAVSPDGTRAYVTNADGDTVSVIDTATNTVIATIPSATAPSGWRSAPTAPRAYVSQLRRRHGVGDRHRHQHRVDTIPVGQPAGGGDQPRRHHAYVTKTTAARCR